MSDEGQKLTRPLMLFDGDCGFCRFWIERWKLATRGAVDFAPAQAEAARLPEITKEKWSRSVQLVTPDGSVYSGAEAVFRSLATVPEHEWMLGAYQNLPGARPVTESAYRLVAGHRNFFSALTHFAIGRDPTPDSFFLSRWVFLRCLGIVYVIAFLSLRVQILGLVGSRGITPAEALLQLVQSQLGSSGYRLFPTLAWFGSSDAALKLLCTGGALFGLLVVLGLVTGPALALCWALYLSLVVVGRDFMTFQWDLLLLEAGFLAIFMAPWQAAEPPWGRASTAPPRSMLWLARWLLFRLMFLSGAVKLLSHDVNWRNLTALTYHYWTQPLPTPVAWYAAQLPLWFQKASCAFVLAVELCIPFLVLCPRRLRRFAACFLVAFQLLIAITGNYAFFNLLSIVLCLLVIDDAWWRRWLPKPIAERASGERPRGRIASYNWVLHAALVLILVTASVGEMLSTLGAGNWEPGFVEQLVQWQEPLGLANAYGLFAVMTTTRLEIEIQGSDDGASWKPYEFKYKPGELARRPPWVAPYQPRLDWQMWFAALGSYKQSPWFPNLMIRLLENSPDVTALLAENPFPNAPPRYIRAVGYDYHFTDFDGRKSTGDWWRRDLKGLYFPIASIRSR